ncbi:MAG: hypothetical protein WDO15_09880 [Bacteroidota bacterium]
MINFTEIHLGEAEDVKLQSTNPEYRNLVKEVQRRNYVLHHLEKEVWNKGSADTAVQRAYYEAHKNKYEAGDRVYARMYSSSDKAFMKQVLEKTKNGDTLSAAIRRSLNLSRPSVRMARVRTRSSI